MKEFFYRLFAVFFNVYAKLLPLKRGRVALVSMHNEQFNDCLGGMKRVFEKDGGYQLVYMTRNDVIPQGKNPIKAVFDALKFFLVHSRLLATSEYVFLNDNFMPMGMLDFKKETAVVQLWHAEGVFKRFGLAIDQPEALRSREIAANSKLTYVVCSSSYVVPYYAEAFGVDEKKVLPLGSPRTDLLYGMLENADVIRSKFDEKYPQAKGKKIVLYAPTFRDDPEKDSELLSSFDAKMLSAQLGAEYCLAVRLHPQLHACEVSNALDLTDYANPVELVLICDVLITDYSSICMDFSLLNKPTVFYAFDLEDYCATRNFYFDYESYVPGEVVKTMAQLPSAVKNAAAGEKNERFRQFNFNAFDGKSAQRVFDSIVKKRG